MDMGIIMNTMRDPAGVPAHPVLFQGLMVVTWVFHIAFVHLALGAAGLALFAFTARDKGPHWTRLSMAMTKIAKVGVSLLIVLGVAPLLFTQVIYDPQWYASNVLSARWAIAFIFTLIVAYCLWFAFYWGNHEGAKKYLGWYATLALILFLLDGLIMHVLAYQALLPQQWMEWYAPNGVVDTRGAQLHAVQWPRFLFIISLAIPAVGLYLLAYADYFSRRADRAADYLEFARSLGRRLTLTGLVLSSVLLLWWQIDNPASTQLLFHPVGWLLFLSLGLLWLAVFYLPAKNRGYALLGGGFSLLGILAVWREIIRIAYLAPFGYSISTYKINVDWPSLALFFSTFIGVGGLVGGFYLVLLYRSGRVQGLYTADRFVARMGTGAVAVLVAWIAIFFIYGITTWVRNAFSV